MKKLFTLTLTVAWLFTIAAPPVVSATTVPASAPAVECSSLPGAPMPDTCEKDTVVPLPGGDELKCKLRDAIPVKIKNSDGSITVVTICDYGPLCGLSPA